MNMLIRMTEMWASAATGVLRQGAVTAGFQGS
jgi:hypothetical protein